MDSLWELPDNRSTPAETMESRDLIRWLLKQLKLEERHLIKWYYLDGLPLKEVAAKAGLSEGRVSVLMSEAISKLNAIIDGKE